jgi:hypothetical protein
VSRLTERAEQAAREPLFENACNRALSADRRTRGEGLLDLLALLSRHDWPSGEKWRTYLVRVLIVNVPNLITKPGPKRSGVIAERDANIRADWARLEQTGTRKSGVRSANAKAIICEKYGIEEETLAKVVRPRTNSTSE